MDDLAVLAEFVAEALEHLVVVGDGLLALEQAAPGEFREKIQPLFRAMHSIKGSAGFLGFKNLEQLAHSSETLLDALRQEKIPCTPALTDLLLLVTDRLRSMVGNLPISQEVPTIDLLARIEATLQVRPATQQAAMIQVPSGMVPPLSVIPAAAISALREQEIVDPLLLAEFTAEAREHLTALSNGLLAMEEAGPELAREGTHPLFRAMHSIKGSAGFLGFGWVERLAHAAETLLDGVRQGIVVFSRDMADLLLRVADRLRGMIDALPLQPSGDDTGLIQNLLTIKNPSPGAFPPATPSVVWSPPATTPPDNQRTQVMAALNHAAEPAQPEGDRASTLRVPVEVIDRLMNLASELVLARNQALETLPTPPDARGRQLMPRISTVTTDLQQAVMLTRMQPAGTLFNRFPRMVRDLARTLEKRIHLGIIGTEVELDKSVLEKLADPLTHLVRNACDHGLEGPAERLRAGKPETGSIDLQARQDGGQILVRVSDDGRGIDPARVRAKAVERGLITSAEAEACSDSQAQALVLRPGFSTVDKVTDLSGRGVGLDVVKTNLESVGGTLVIDSVPGKGTTFLLRLPLTLAIIPALVVRLGGERLCLPQRDLEELVSASQCRISEMGGHDVVELRGQPLEVIHLRKVLGLTGMGPQAPGPESVRGPSKGFLAVVRAAGRRVTLAVDELVGSQEIVVKPLHPLLRGLGFHGGATVLADGLPALILDVEGVVRASGPALLPQLATGPEQMASRLETPTQAAVIFEYGPSERFAAPLALLRRVDRVVASQLERVGNHRVACLESGNLVMVGLDEVLAVGAAQENEQELFLLSPRKGQPGRALIATRILDTTMVPMVPEPSPLKGPGILGSVRVDGRLTLLIDPGEILMATALAEPGWTETIAAGVAP